MTDFDSFFNAKPAVPEQQTFQLTEFKPNPDKAPGGVFNAVVRFVPNPVDPVNKSIIMKYCVFLENTAAQAKMTVDCPSTIGAPDPIQNTFFALRGSSNAVLAENSKKFSRKQQFASLIQVLESKSDPSLNGKLLVWKYGMKVHEKLMAEMNPPMGEPKNPFSLLAGRPFNVCVKKVGGFPNYDGCGFFDLPIENSGLRVVNPANGQSYIVTPSLISSNEGKELVINYIKDNAPSLEKYEYHPWTEEQTAFVNSCIQLYSNPTASMAAYAAATNPGVATVAQQPMVAQAAAQPTISNGFTAPAPAPQMPMGDPFAGMTPQMGLGVAQAAPVAPGGFNAPALGDDINGLLGGAPAAPKAAPSMAMSLEDVLGDQML